MGGNILWYVQGRGGCKGSCRILLSFSLFSCSFNKKKNCKAWQCYTLYVMPAAFPHTSSFPGGWAIKQQSPSSCSCWWLWKSSCHMQVCCSWDIDPTTSGIVSHPSRASVELSYFFFFFLWNGEQRLERLICNLCTETSWREKENVLCQKQAENHNSCREDHVYSLIFLVRHSKN